VPQDRAKVGPEFLWSLESGLKMRSADDRIRGQLAAFYMRRSEQQVSTSFQVDPGDPLSFIFITDNAARGTNYGLEGTLSWQPSDGWLLGGSAGLLRTEYLDYRLGDRDLSGRDQAHAPRRQFSLVAQYRHPAGFLARVDAQYVSSFYYDTSHDERSVPYSLVNLKVGYEGERWSAFAWARNLFDESYAMRGFYFGNEPPDFPPKRYVQPGDPRQLGVTVSYSFE
jgi:outer membrane receptor protein involved in Fe transport